MDDQVVQARTPAANTRLSRQWVGIVIAGIIPPALYILVVGHYGVNMLFGDDWTVIPVVDSAVNHHLTWQLLWAQHNENRMLFPNLLFILFGRIDHLDAKTIMYFSALLLTGGFLLLLCVYRSYAGAFMGPFQTLLAGLVWFSLSEFENTLWAFQLAWFMVDASLLLLLFLFSRRPRSYLLLSAAAIVAVVASYSSLQGLILWPVGLLCLLWRREDRRRSLIQGAIWIVATLVTTGLYFLGFDFSSRATGGGSIGYAISHPVGVAKYIMAAVGNVLPSGWPPSHSSVIFHEIVGLMLLVVAAIVLWHSWRERSQERMIPLPAALILFAVLFDVSIALGRSNSGASQALSYRYTMANLLLLIGVAIYGFSRFAKPAMRSHRRSRHARSRKYRLARPGLLSTLVLFLSAQIAQGTNIGLASSHATQQLRETGALTVLNLTKMPSAQAKILVEQDVYPPGLGPIEPLLRAAAHDKLSVFAPGADKLYVGHHGHRPR